MRGNANLNKIRSLEHAAVRGERSLIDHQIAGSRVVKFAIQPALLSGEKHLTGFRKRIRGSENAGSPKINAACQCPGRRHRIDVPLDDRVRSLILGGWTVEIQMRTADREERAVLH